METKSVRMKQLATEYVVISHNKWDAGCTSTCTHVWTSINLLGFLA